jgi:hypothetical protein
MTEKQKTTRQRLLLGSGTRATREVQLEEVFSMRSTPRLYLTTDQVQLVSQSVELVSEVEWSELVGSE